MPKKKDVFDISLSRLPDHSPFRTDVAVKKKGKKGSGKAVLGTAAAILLTFLAYKAVK